MKFFTQPMFWIDTICSTIVSIFLVFVLPFYKNPSLEQALEPSRVFMLFIICFTISIIRYKFFKKISIKA